MFERINDLAEKLAKNLSQSRRGFLVRAEQTALSTVRVLGALVATPG
jgi:hypothetical protein